MSCKLPGQVMINWQRSLTFERQSPGWLTDSGLGMMRLLVPPLTPLHPTPELIGHAGAMGTWLYYCPLLDLILAGAVSQIAAGPVPFLFLPRVIWAIKPYLPA